MLPKPIAVSACEKVSHRGLGIHLSCELSQLLQWTGSGVWDTVAHGDCIALICHSLRVIMYICRRLYLTDLINPIKPPLPQAFPVNAHHEAPSVPAVVLQANHDLLARLA